jgi:hypothetical protein
MGFLDNLENNLKSLENAEEGREDAERQRRARERESARTLAAAPFADLLRSGPFSGELMKHAARVGFTLRTKVHIAWLDQVLRLEARERRLELQPTPEGVIAVYFTDGKETRREPVDLSGDAEALVKAWLTNT